MSRDFRPIFPDSNPSGALTNSLKQFCSRFIRDFRSQGSKILTPRCAGHSRIKILPDRLLKSNQNQQQKFRSWFRGVHFDSAMPYTPGSFLKIRISLWKGNSIRKYLNCLFKGVQSSGLIVEKLRVQNLVTHFF